MKAVAVIRPLGEVRVVQTAVEGTIQTLKAIENQVVKQGDIIAYIDDSHLQTQKSQFQDKIQHEQQQLNEIDDQIRALKAQITAESSYLKRTIASARDDLTRNQREYQNQQVITQTELQETEANLKLAKDERDRYRYASESGVVSRLQYTAKEQGFRVAEARLARAKAALYPSNANVTVAVERIAQEKARGESTLGSLNREQKALLQSRVELASQINKDQKDLHQLSLERKKNVLRSPVNGVILKLNLRNKDQVVRAGDTIAQIAPSNTALVVKALVTVQDIGKVAVGQKAQLRVSTYPYPDYGVIQGKVIAVAPDAISAQTNATTLNQFPASSLQGSLSNGTNGYYEVTIQPATPDFIKVGDNMPEEQHQYSIQPGMEGTVDIISREETVLKFILRKIRLSSDF